LNSSHRERQRRGYSLIEIMTVVVVIGVLVMMAFPSFRRSRIDQQLKDSARGIVGALAYARSEAIRTGNVHAVFFGTDAAGNALTDAAGNPVQVLVLDDGPLGSPGQNCNIDPGERISTVTVMDGLAIGALAGVMAVPSDLGTGAIATGSSFTEPDGDPASWVLFRPDGTPLSFDAACALGPTGSGAGAFYVNNGERMQAVVLRPLGGMRAETWDPASGRWTD